MRLTINPTHIHHSRQPIVDEHGEPTGQVIDVVTLDVNVPNHPDLPTYGISIDLPLTKDKVKNALEALAGRINDQLANDEIVRDQISSFGLLDYQAKLL